MWINSLGIPGVFVHNLYEDIRDGIVLLKVEERVKGQGSVPWGKADLNPTNSFKKVQNTNLAIDVAKSFGFKLEGIGGKDLYEGNKKLSLALVWQLVRMHTLSTIGNMTEDKLLEWANARIKNAPKITSFKDNSLKNSRWIIELIESIEKRAIDWNLVKPGTTQKKLKPTLNTR